MNIAIILAGGTGQRMNTRTKPKQFLELHGKPILIYTLEQFENHEQIDEIIVVCIENWIACCKELLSKFHITKVRAVIPGGETGMLSRVCGLKKAAELYDNDTICLIHDGVRPLIDYETISKNIESVKTYGSGVTVTPVAETIAVKDLENRVGEVIDRSKCQLARSPQSFRLGELLEAHLSALDKGINNYIDAATLMQQEGHTVYIVEGPPENIKITAPSDFYIFRALTDARENSQIFG